jgi:hypothetical protein
MHVRAVDLSDAQEDHRIRVKQAAEAAAPNINWTTEVTMTPPGQYRR